MLFEISTILVASDANVALDWNVFVQPLIEIDPFTGFLLKHFIQE